MAAIKENRALEGMDRDQVLLALGRPRHKMRETKEGVELEDWIYGEAPGKMTFVTFNGNKVVKVKDAYAGLGGSTAEPLKLRFRAGYSPVGSTPPEPASSFNFSSTI